MKVEYDGMPTAFTGGFVPITIPTTTVVTTSVPTPTPDTSPEDIATATLPVLEPSIPEPEPELFSSDDALTDDGVPTRPLIFADSKLIRARKKSGESMKVYIPNWDEDEKEKEEMTEPV